MTENIKSRPINYEELITFIKSIALHKKCTIKFQQLSQRNINPGIIVKFKGLKININKYFNVIKIGSFNYEIPKHICSLPGYGYFLQPLSSYLFEQQQAKFRDKRKLTYSDNNSIKLYYSILEGL